jgi:hypothetical protein
MPREKHSYSRCRILARTFLLRPSWSDRIWRRRGLPWRFLALISPVVMEFNESIVNYPSIKRSPRRSLERLEEATNRARRASWNYAGASRWGARA